MCDTDNCLIHIAPNARYDCWLHLFSRQNRIRIRSSCNLNVLKLLSWFFKPSNIYWWCPIQWKKFSHASFFIEMQSLCKDLLKRVTVYAYLGRRFVVCEKKKERSTVTVIDRRQLSQMEEDKSSACQWWNSMNIISWYYRVISDFLFLTGMRVSRCKLSWSGIFEGIEYLSRRNLFLPFFVLSIAMVGHSTHSDCIDGILQILRRITHTRKCINNVKDNLSEDGLNVIEIL